MTASILVEHQTNTLVDRAYAQHLRNGQAASVCHRPRPGEVVFYYFRNYGMRVETLFQVDDFQWAVIRGNFDDMKQAIRSGADVNRVTANGLSPLQWAAKRRHERCVQGLIARGAIVNSRVLRSVEDNHMREFIERCLLNRTVAQHYQVAMIVLHNPTSPFRALDTGGALVELFRHLMPRQLPRHMLVDLLRVVIGQERMIKTIACGDGAMRASDREENVMNWSKRIQ